MLFGLLGVEGCWWPGSPRSEVACLGR